MKRYKKIQSNIFNKKSQAAMEFLMTYGWAILIIMVVMAILFSLDVFNPKVPNTCSSISPITCYDIKLNKNGIIEITLSSSDTINDDTSLNKIILNGPIKDDCVGVSEISGGDPPGNDILTDTKSTLSCDITSQDLTSGNIFDGNAEVTYILFGGSISHKINLKFSGTIEEN